MLSQLSLNRLLIDPGVEIGTANFGSISVNWRMYRPQLLQSINKEKVGKIRSFSGLTIAGSL